MGEKAERIAVAWVEKFQLAKGDRTIGEIARAAGITENYLRNALSKRAEPGAGRAILYAKALGVPVEWLFGDGPDELPAPPPTPALPPHQPEALRYLGPAGDELQRVIARLVAAALAQAASSLTSEGTPATPPHEPPRYGRRR